MKYTGHLQRHLSSSLHPGCFAPSACARIAGRLLILAAFLLPAGSTRADWSVLPASDQRHGLPGDMNGAQPIKVGDKLPDDHKFRWLIGDLQIPDTIDKKPTAGQPVGMQINCGDGGEVWVDGKLQVRFDNDHPALAMLTSAARPGQKVRIAVQVYGKVQGGGEFGEARWVIVDPARANAPVRLTLDAATTTGAVPDGLIGLSQGGGMSDYHADTAAKLRAGGFKWFRMDNILTNALKKGPDGKLVYDWTDLDRRVDFIHEMGAQPIFAVSYMPQVLDAVPDNERHSAPKDYKAWEELCYEAAARCLARGRRVPQWEVWNETNAGWLKPGPEDTGTEAFTRMYSDALGKPATDHGTVRRFEAYCKLYRATALGVRRADPEAQVGGPVLASGPYEQGGAGPGFNGRGFARGLMLWCAQEKLPLDFISWHEYFQGSDVMGREVKEMRTLLDGFPTLKPQVRSLVLSEWNEAWWADRPQDNEIGAAWCADCVTRCFIPDHLDRPCLFYAKQGDDNFRGDYGILMGQNIPKATYNMAKVFNSLSGQWLRISGADDDVSAVACWDAARKRLAVVLVNFRYRYGIGRQVNLHIDHLPDALAGGTWRQWTIDATHSNVWNDRATAELQQTGTGTLGNADFTPFMPANSIVLLELTGK